jgi:hypothetical protein
MKFDKSRLRINTEIEQLIWDGWWLAGGAIRASFADDEEIMDYDLFFKNKLCAAGASIKLEELGYKVIFNCPEGKLTTYKKDNIKVQIITENFYSDVESLINTFDIKACRVVFDGKFIYGYYSSIRDIIKKSIKLHRVDFPAATMKRIAKYIKKGYTLDNQAIKFFIDTIYSAGFAHKDIDRRFYID